MRHSIIVLLRACLVAISTTVLAQSVPPLVNYQGRLTDQTGAPLTAGVYGIQFRLWDSALAAGTNDLIWGQQYANLAVQSNGVFNVIIGSPGGTSIPGTAPAVNNLAYAFASSNVFLGVTVTVSNGVALTSPSEILPRQQLLSVPFAFTANLALNAVNASNAVIASIAASVVNGSVGLTNLAPRLVITNSTPLLPAPIGSIVVSGSSGNFQAASSAVVSNLNLTITTSGRPVFVGLISDAQTSNNSYIGLYANNGVGSVLFQINRNGVQVGIYNLTSFNIIAVPSSSLYAVDLPPGPGTYTYSVSILNPNPLAYLYQSKLIAYEF